MKTKPSTITIGIDLGDRKHAVCALDAKGDIIKEETINNNRGALTALSRRYPGALMVMEVGMHSPWISRFLNRRCQSRLTSIAGLQVRGGRDGRGQG